MSLSDPWEIQQYRERRLLGKISSFEIPIREEIFSKRKQMKKLKKI